MSTEFPRNTNTTRLLAQILLTLPIAWVLTAPLNEVRTLAHAQARTLKALAAAGIFDLDGHTAIQPLLMLDGLTTGHDGHPFRDDLVEALGVIAHEVAHRTVDLDPTPVAAVESLPDVWGPMPGHTDGCNPFGECDTTCETAEVAA